MVQVPVVSKRLTDYYLRRRVDRSYPLVLYASLMTATAKDLHNRIQFLLAGEDIVACARALTLSLAAVVGSCVDSPHEADPIFDALANDAKQDLRTNWNAITESRKQSDVMHDASDRVQ